MENLVSIVSAIISLFYLNLGINTFKLNKKSKECFVFLLLNLSLFIWSFAYSFAYMAPNALQSLIWNKLAAVGWCLFPALVLYFVFLITNKRFINNTIWKHIIFLPSILLLVMNFVIFEPHQKYSGTIITIFYIADFWYNTLYFIGSFLILFVWWRNSKIETKKKQARIILITSAISFVLNYFTQTILPQYGVTEYANLGQMYALVMMCGVNYAIIKYHFLHIPLSLVAKEVFNEMMDLTFLTDMKGNVIQINKQVNSLLQYREDELLNSPITNLIKAKQLTNLYTNNIEQKDTIKLNEIIIESKYKERIPFRMTITPLQSDKTKDLLGVLIIAQDIRVIHNLTNEMKNHRITSEKLYKSEELFRTMVETLPFSIILSDKNDNTLLYINHKTEELFHTTSEKILGKMAEHFYYKREEREQLMKELLNNNKIEEREVMFQREDKSTFPALISIVSTIYNDREVLLASLVDITERKRDQVKLEKSKEQIQEINNKLLRTNSLLQEKSIRDGLTNLYNHQYIIEILEKELIRMTKLGKELCLMMLDIDFFKRVNDNYGHQVGDMVLVTIAKLINDNVRSTDILGRYGGEEFLAILPDVNMSEAFDIAERIRKSVEDYMFEIKGLKVTISIGVTEYNKDEAKILINRADTLLYKAKNNGRNRVEIE